MELNTCATCASSHALHKYPEILLDYFASKAISQQQRKYGSRAPLCCVQVGKGGRVRGTELNEASVYLVQKNRILSIVHPRFVIKFKCRLLLEVHIF